FLIGHSQGGLVVLRYGLRNPNRVQGVVASGAALMTALPVPAWKITLSRLLSVAMPSFSLANGIPLDRLSHNPAVAEARRADPYLHGVASARWAVEFFGAQADTLASAPRFTLPCLLLHGGDDQLVSPESSRRFYATCGSTDKTLKIYDGLYHELYNETGKEQILAEVAAWLDARAAA
ncbi:MAG: lysophospholipase, partial [Chloroflexi bacterium]|nr:lysophospholipase [Chloroflexota bacterium]